MCELFGASLKKPERLNGYLKEFYSHGKDNPNGWGLALLSGREAEIEKEPMEADKSHYLKRRLGVPVTAQNALAHIRYATIGNEEYWNCHPFTGTDASGRRWTLIHNGTIFEFEPLNRYTKLQKGDTDSERILLYILDQMNDRIEDRRNLAAKERFAVMDDILCRMSKGNKLNLLLYDGELMYVHTNYPDTLYYLQKESGMLFSTKPLSDERWKKVPMTTLFACRDGELVFEGTDHGNVYVKNEADMQMLYLAFSSL